MKQTLKTIITIITIIGLIILTGVLESGRIEQLGL